MIECKGKSASTNNTVKSNNPFYTEAKGILNGSSSADLAITPSEVLHLNSGRKGFEMKYESPEVDLDCKFPQKGSLSCNISFHSSAPKEEMLKRFEKPEDVLSLLKKFKEARGSCPAAAENSSNKR